MSVERDVERIDRNQTFEVKENGNCAENRTNCFSDISNVTLPDVNATEAINSFYFYKTEQFTVLWLLFVMIVVGNVAVLIGLLWGKRRKTRMDFFIKQLAFADLLVGLISVLTDIIWRTTVTWHAGNIACKLIRFMQAVVTYSSTYVLVALSIDRYDAITRPMNFTGRWWRARALVIVAWSLSAIFSAPIFFLYEEKRIQGKIQCWIDLGSPLLWRIYMSLVSFTLFIAPALIIGGCYAVIVATIWSQGGALRQGPTRDTRRASSRGLIPRAKVKTVKMTLVIVFGDSMYPDLRTQTGRTTYKQETPLFGDQMAIEKMQTKLKFLENSNIVMQTRNQNLITENKALVSRLREEQNEVKKFEKRISSLEEELEAEKLKLEEFKKETEQTKKDPSKLITHGTSTTNIVSKMDRGVHIWAVCMGCQRKLEGCEKQLSTVTITKSELEVLEKDMQTLRDTIIAREEAWDRAMEREQNYRQQLTRLTTETITARHLSDTRYEEEKESELKALQKDNLHLNKLVTKLYNCCQRGQDGCNRNNLAIEINEKDQRFLEELVRRTSNVKTKQKPKSKSACSERTPLSVVYQLVTSPREKSARTPKDQTSSFKESKR